jgi:hypothetical protein
MDVFSSSSFQKLQRLLGILSLTLAAVLVQAAMATLTQAGIRHAPVLPVDAQCTNGHPSVDVRHRKRGDLGPAQGAAQGAR